MEKLMHGLKLAEEKKGKCLSLIDEVQAKSSSIVSITSQWKDLDLRYSAIRESLLRQGRELALQGTEMEEARKRVELREMEVEVKLEAARRLVREKEEELGLLKDQIRECEWELQGKEKELGFRQREFSELGWEICKKERERDSVQRAIEVESKELRAKRAELIEVRSLIVQCNDELELKEKQLSMVTGKLQVKEGEMGFAERRLVECREELVGNEKLLGSLRNSLAEQYELELSNAKEDRQREEAHERQGESRWLRESVDELSNAKQAGTADGAASYDSSTVEEPSPPYLIDDEVSTAIRQSPEPAKMILDQLKQSISQIDAKKYSETLAINRVVMLEQLMGVSPKVSPEVEEAGKELAVDWRRNLRLEGRDSMDVLGFFLFLAAFGVGCSRFEAEDMLELVETIAHHERAPELCRSIGLTQSIPGLIKRLSEKDMHMEAIRFSLAFKLAEDFPPNLFLLSHLKKTRIFEDGNGLLESQYQALNKHLNSLVAISERVSELGLDPSFVNQKIEDHLQKLDALVGRKKSCLIATRLVIQTPRYACAAASGNKRPLQLGNSTEAGQRRKRQRKSDPLGGHRRSNREPKPNPRFIGGATKSRRRRIRQVKLADL